MAYSLGLTNLEKLLRISKDHLDDVLDVNDSLVTKYYLEEANCKLQQCNHCNSYNILRELLLSHKDVKEMRQCTMTLEMYCKTKHIPEMEIFWNQFFESEEGRTLKVFSRNLVNTHYNSDSESISDDSTEFKYNPSSGTEEFDSDSSKSFARNELLDGSTAEIASSSKGVGSSKNGGSSENGGSSK